MLACQDAYRLFPWAEFLYGCDDRWWRAHDGCPDFKGEKWSTHGDAGANDKREVAEMYGLNLVAGKPEDGFSTNPAVIHYGDNSGFQAINMAVLLGSPYIVLVGFNLSRPGNKTHFFGDHPAGMHNQDNYEQWLPKFRKAAETCETTIINATPDSAIDCWPVMTLEDAIADYRVHRHRAIANG